MNLVQARAELGNDKASCALASLVSDKLAGLRVGQHDVHLREQEVALDLDVEAGIVAFIEAELVLIDALEDIIRVDRLIAVALIELLTNLDGTSLEHCLSLVSEDHVKHGSVGKAVLRVVPGVTRVRLNDLLCVRNSHHGELKVNCLARSLQKLSVGCECKLDGVVAGRQLCEDTTVMIFEHALLDDLP